MKELQVLRVNLGEGRFAIEPCSEDEGYGILIIDTGEPHKVGDLVPGSEVKGSEAILIHCANRESALVLMEQVCRVVAMFSDDEVRKAAERNSK